MFKNDQRLSHWGNVVVELLNIVLILQILLEFVKNVLSYLLIKVVSALVFQILDLNNVHINASSNSSPISAVPSIRNTQ